MPLATSLSVLIPTKEKDFAAGAVPQECTVSEDRPGSNPGSVPEMDLV